MIRTLDEARALLARSGAMTVVPAGPCPSLVGELIGEVKGSWWAHPRGGEVYGILDALHDDPDVLSAKLVDGKNTLLHRSLWSELLRLALDEAWRKGALARLDSGGRALVKQIEAAGTLRADALSPSLRREGEAVAKSLLVHADQAHTERGRHERVFQSWREWARGRGVTPTASPFDEALARIERACGERTPFARPKRD